MQPKILVSRRSFLKSSAVLGMGMCVQAMLPRAALAAENAKLLIVNLNGGLDGLAALQPSSGSVYDVLKSVRPTLAKAPAGLLPCTSTLGFHPNLTSLKSLFDQGSLSAILNVGCRNMSRSHLEAEIALTRGVTDRMSQTSSGLINRIGSQYGWSSLRAIGVTGDDPIFAGGDYRAIQAGSLEDLYFRAPNNNFNEVDHLVASMYDVAASSTPEFGKPTQNDYLSNLKTVIDNTATVQQGVKSYTPPTSYPQTQFGKALKSAEIAMSAPQIASQIVYLRTIGFDTHSNQAPTLDRLLSELNAALSVFITNAKSSGLWQNLVVLVISEFGRTNRENGSGGTDHGGANAVFVLGGRVRGGIVLGEISGASLASDGWLAPTFNYAELYRQALIPVGLDPNKIVPVTEGPSLAGLFT